MEEARRYGGRCVEELSRTANGEKPDRVIMDGVNTSRSQWMRKATRVRLGRRGVTRLDIDVLVAEEARR